MDLLKKIQECRPEFKSVEEFKGLFERTLKALQKTSKDFEVYGNTIDYDKYLEYENQLKVIVVLGICNSNGEKMLVDAKSLFDYYYEPFKIEQRIKFLKNSYKTDPTPQLRESLGELEYKLYILNIEHGGIFKDVANDLEAIVKYLSSKPCNSLLEQTNGKIDLRKEYNEIDGRLLPDVEEDFDFLVNDTYNVSDIEVNHFVARAFANKKIGSKIVLCLRKKDDLFFLIMQFYKFYVDRPETKKTRRDYINLFLENFEIHWRSAGKWKVVDYGKYNNDWRDSNMRKVNSLI